MYQSIIYIPKVTGGLLDPIKITIGLKQGDVLSQILFNLYVTVKVRNQSIRDFISQIVK